MYPPDQTATTAPRGLASIADLLGSRLARHGDAVATRHDAGDRYVDTTYAELLANAGALARWFLARPGRQQLVVTLCKNRPEWDMTALAVFHTANILCPLDITMNRAEIEGLLSLRPPDVMLVSRAQLVSQGILKQSSLTFESSISSYETGGVDFLNVLSNFLAVIDSELDQHEQVRNHEKALARLEELAGMETNP